MSDRQAYHHGNLRRALLDASLALFAARGSFDFTLRELAKSAGVTHNAPYRHFAGKAELLAALRDEGSAMLDAACRARLEGAEGPRARVRALGEAYVRFAIAHPHHFRLALHNPLGGDAAPQGEAFPLLRTTLADAQKAGAVRDDLSARELALGAWALVHGLASLLVEGNIAGDEARLRRYMRLLDAIFFDGAGAGASRGARPSR
jgi:AcrR family transcriptional regulator